MYAIDLKPELEKQLADFATRNGVTIDSLLGEALERVMEDVQDIVLLEEALRDPEAGQRISHAQMRRELGLDD